MRAKGEQNQSRALLPVILREARRKAHFNINTMRKPQMISSVLPMAYVME